MFSKQFGQQVVENSDIQMVLQSENNDKEQIEYQKVAKLKLSQSIFSNFNEVKNDQVIVRNRKKIFFLDLEKDEDISESDDLEANKKKIYQTFQSMDKLNTQHELVKELPHQENEEELGLLNNQIEKFQDKINFQRKENKQMSTNLSQLQQQQLQPQQKINNQEDQKSQINSFKELIVIQEDDLSSYKINLATTYNQLEQFQPSQDSSKYLKQNNNENMMKIKNNQLQQDQSLQKNKVLKSNQNQEQNQEKNQLQTIYSSNMERNSICQDKNNQLQELQQNYNQNLGKNQNIQNNLMTKSNEDTPIKKYYVSDDETLTQKESFEFNNQNLQQLQNIPRILNQKAESQQYDDHSRIQEELPYEKSDFSKKFTSHYKQQQEQMQENYSTPYKLDKIKLGFKKSQEQKNPSQNGNEKTFATAQSLNLGSQNKFYDSNQKLNEELAMKYSNIQPETQSKIPAILLKQKFSNQKQQQQQQNQNIQVMKLQNNQDQSQQNYQNFAKNQVLNNISDDLIKQQELSQNFPNLHNQTGYQNESTANFVSNDEETNPVDNMVKKNNTSSSKKFCKQISYLSNSKKSRQIDHPQELIFERNGNTKFNVEMDKQKQHEEQKSSLQNINNSNFQNQDQQQRQNYSYINGDKQLTQQKNQFQNQKQQGFQKNNNYQQEYNQFVQNQLKNQNINENNFKNQKEYHRFICNSYGDIEFDYLNTNENLQDKRFSSKKIFKNSQVLLDQQLKKSMMDSQAQNQKDKQSMQFSQINPEFIQQIQQSQFQNQEKSQNEQKQQKSYEKQNLENFNLQDSYFEIEQEEQIKEIKGGNLNMFIQYNPNLSQNQSQNISINQGDQQNRIYRSLNISPIQSKFQSQTNSVHQSIQNSPKNKIQQLKQKKNINQKHSRSQTVDFDFHLNQNVKNEQKNQIGGYRHFNNLNNNENDNIQNQYKNLDNLKVELSSEIDNSGNCFEIPQNKFKSIKKEFIKNLETQEQKKLQQENLNNQKQKVVFHSHHLKNQNTNQQNFQQNLNNNNHNSCINNNYYNQFNSQNENDIYDKNDNDKIPSSSQMKFNQNSGLINYSQERKESSVLNYSKTENKIEEQNYQNYDQEFGVLKNQIRELQNTEDFMKGLMSKQQILLQEINFRIEKFDKNQNSRLLNQNPKNQSKKQSQSNISDINLTYSMTPINHHSKLHSNNSFNTDIMQTNIQNLGNQIRILDLQLQEQSRTDTLQITETTNNNQNEINSQKILQLSKNYSQNIQELEKVNKKNQVQFLVSHLIENLQHFQKSDRLQKKIKSLLKVAKNEKQKLQTQQIYTETSEHIEKLKIQIKQDIKELEQLGHKLGQNQHNISGAQIQKFNWENSIQVIVQQLQKFQLDNQK